MNYSKSLTFYFLILIGISAYAQGGWNIGYIVSDSISTSEIGKRIKIDLKKENVRKERLKKSLTERGIKYNPIWRIRNMDSIQMQIEHEDYLIYEVREIGVDYGYYDDQYLILKSKKKKLKVFDSEILEINNDKIRFRLFIGKRKKGTPANPRINPIFKDVWIDKKLVDGVMYKK